MLLQAIACEAIASLSSDEQGRGILTSLSERIRFSDPSTAKRLDAVGALQVSSFITIVVKPLFVIESTLDVAAVGGFVVLQRAIRGSGGLGKADVPSQGVLHARGPEGSLRGTCCADSNVNRDS